MKAKLLAGAGFVAAGIMIVLAAGLYFCYERVIVVERENQKLTEKIDSLGIALEEAVRFTDRVATVTAELGKKDEERQGQYRQFSSRLSALKKTDNDLRRVLDSVVPHIALLGLRSFDSGQTSSDATNTLTLDRAVKDTNKR